MVSRVAERGAREATLAFEDLPLVRDPLEEAVDVKPQELSAKSLDLGRRFVLPRSIKLEDASDAHERFLRDLTLRRRSLPKTSPCVIPTADLDALAAVVLEIIGLLPKLVFVRKQQVEDRLRVGLNVAAVTSKALVDGAAVVFFRGSQRGCDRDLRW